MTEAGDVMHTEVEKLLRNAQANFALVAQFVDQVNKGTGEEVFRGGEARGVIWFHLYRSKTQRDHYSLDLNGVLYRERQVSRYLDSWDDWVAEVLGCSPDEFAGAMRKKIEQRAQGVGRAAENAAALAARICKPLIRVGQNVNDLGDGKPWLAQIDAYTTYGDGYCPYSAADRLIDKLDRAGTKVSRDDYTIVMV